MKRVWGALLAATVGGLAFWACTKLFPGDEAKIRHSLQGLATTASFGPGESAVARLTRANKLGGFFAPEVVISLEVTGFDAVAISGRDELVQMVLAARSNLRGLTIEVLDIVVQLAQDKRSAAVYLTAKGQVSGEQDFVAQEFKLQLIKPEKHWLVTRVETFRTFGG